MRISETLELSMQDDVNIDKMERYLVGEVKKFGKRVFGRVLQELEAKELAVE